MYKPSSTYRIQFHKAFNLQDAKRILTYLGRLQIGAVYASPVFESVPGSTHGYDGLNPTAINPEIGTLEELEELIRQLQDNQTGWIQDIVPNHLAFDPRNPWLKDVLKNGKKSAFAGFFDILWDTPGNEKLMVPFLGNPLEEEVSNGAITLVADKDGCAFKYGDALYPARMETVADNHHSSGQQVIQQINNNKEKLLQLLHQQEYRLCSWKETVHTINYRRFFTVNGLICINIQDPEVFNRYHQLIIELVKKNLFSGLRIDHIDGLFDPKGYLDQLHDKVGKETYVIVEKILQPDESIPNDWKTQGNTGYDFLAVVNNLFTSRQHEKLLTQYYYELDPSYKTFEQQLRDKKRWILHQQMQGELENLVRLFFSLELMPADTNNRDEIKQVIAELLVNCPVYRYYGNKLPLDESEAVGIHRILEQIRQTNPAIAAAANALEKIFLDAQNRDDGYNKKALYFFQRCMQFSGPLMAKGLEDTLMYNYHRFIAHNEVGDSPGKFGYSIDQFHTIMQHRQQHWPYSINTTSTHDTKRGEDVRARLNVLSEIAPDWIANVEEWKKMNESFKTNDFPDPHTEYFIYQALTGHAPMPGNDDRDYLKRMNEFLQKALREGKVHSDWGAPDENKEKAAMNFVATLLDPHQPFNKSFQSFNKQVIDFGILNSLMQLILKFTCPGIPDVYQGTELWDLSFVDPDNRRPVDYSLREQYLDEIERFQNDASFFKSLWNERYSGKIKLWLTQTLLGLRRQHHQLFTEGEYISLKVKGKYKDHVLAFARKNKKEILTVIVPLYLATICNEQQQPWQQIDWKDTLIELPENVSDARSLFSNGTGWGQQKSLSANELFREMPFAIIKASHIPNARAAGILLHISSLSSGFGIGDLGPEAYRFADFLQHTQQRYWQLLPINPVEAGQGYSPYSATSTKAGNLLLVSPEMLVAEGFLNQEDLESHFIPASGKVDFNHAAAVRTQLLKKGFENFSKSASEQKRQEFDRYCEQEREWLDDFALYSMFKLKENGKPWYEWPAAYKMRDETAVKDFSNSNAEGLRFAKWQQFVFASQWKSLRKYCNDRDIELIGDLPFYVSYDSADVWAAPHLFQLDKKGNRKAVAGVPPDAFSEDGQLWGMPVFRWNVMKKDNYSWWVKRLKKNIELFDKVRLDHFRAFSSYWEVPATESTARNGKWIKGPGTDLFKTLQKEFGYLPFIAEDLGEIDEPVYALRDRFRLPGMKVLQFAFGSETGISPHSPHNHAPNFLVYTGTHDNNTTVGWWRETGPEVQDAVQQYAGRFIEENEIADLFCRMAYASTANIVILPMQDLLGLDEEARMNKPSTSEGNWNWRLVPGQITERETYLLQQWTNIYNRR